MNPGSKQELIIPVTVSGIDTSHTRIGPETHFFQDMKRLQNHLALSADAFLIGTTSEVHRLSYRQRNAVYHAMTTHSQDSFAKNIPIMAGILGSDATILEQVKQAQEFGIKRFALGLNHTGDNETRVKWTLKAMRNQDTLMLYHMPGGFEPASIDKIYDWALHDKRIIGVKDSSGNPVNYLGLLEVGKNIPGFQVFHGSEAGWRQLTDEQRQQSAGLISGTANVDPVLLRKFMTSPESVASSYDDLTRGLAVMEQPFSPDVRGGNIQSYIFQMKQKLIRLGIFFSPNSGAMYSEPGKDFFV